MVDLAGPKKVHAIITCHNRVSKTKSCLTSLLLQSTERLNIDVTCVDDGSSDGTSDMIRTVFPAATVLAGDGTLYWSGGMRLAQKAALKMDPDFLLLLNDDVELYEGSIAHLVHTFEEEFQETSSPVIVVGSTIDAITEQTTYTGLLRGPWHNRLNFKSAPESHKAVQCDTFHGNCVLVPRAIFEKVVPFDGSFRHAMSDMDFGLRAKKFGFHTLLAPKPVGTCSRNETTALRHNRGKFIDRLRFALSPKGLPIRDWLIFTRRHAGIAAPILFFRPYILFCGHEIKLLAMRSAKVLCATHKKSR